MSRVIAIVGATGAQGLSVVRRVLRPSDDGSPSPRKVRALTRTQIRDVQKSLKVLVESAIDIPFQDIAMLTMNRIFQGSFVDS